VFKVIDLNSLKSRVGNVEVTIGAILPSNGSTKKEKTGAWRAKRPIFDQTKCKGCGLCWIFCPEAAVIKDNDTFKPDLYYCKGCGICANECKENAITMIEETK
jgi:pyruvate ferredoxin oxidoreductase delta subunit